MHTNNEKTISRIVSLMDLTSLNDSDTEGGIRALCKKAATPYGTPAAVCIYPAFIGTAHEALKGLGLRARIRIATVTNFPTGNDDAAQAARETEQAVALGADEVDIVFPWRALMEGDTTPGRALVKACRKACDERVLKVIIESGQLQRADLIRLASTIAIEEGADFIKTSTGKVPVNATPEAARVMLQTIADLKRPCGFKAAGGVRNQTEAQTYLDLASEILGTEWATPERFRFGTSSLLDNLLATPDTPVHASY